MNKQQKLFAFKLAEKETARKAPDVQANPGKWQARDGAAVAGCTDFRFPGNLRYSDNGVYC